MKRWHFWSGVLVSLIFIVLALSQVEDWAVFGRSLRDADYSWLVLIVADERRADRSGARVALILGEDEVAEQMVGVKPLREDTGQDNIGWAELSTRLPGYIK